MEYRCGASRGPRWHQLRWRENMSARSPVSPPIASGGEARLRVAAGIAGGRCLRSSGPANMASVRDLRNV